MRRLAFVIGSSALTVTVAACSGGSPPEPQVRAAPDAVDDVVAGETSTGAGVDEPASAEAAETSGAGVAVQPEFGQEDAGAGSGETGEPESLTARLRREGDKPPLLGQELGHQPTIEEEAAPPVEANLAPEHIEQAIWDAMSDRERRAARAKAAAQAYEDE